MSGVLPNFLIIGAQKSGTSWLRDVLVQHPDVYMCRKELHFFDKHHRFERGLSWYQDQFCDADGEKAIGEKTPDYLWAHGEGAEGHRPDVHLNIHQTLPEARLIVVLRDPVARAVSALKHVIRTHRISPLHDFDSLLYGPKQTLVRAHGILEKGRYYEQLSAYLEFFPRESLLVLFFEEDVRVDPDGCLTRVCAFLGVDPAFRFDRVRENRDEGKLSRSRLAVDYHCPRLRPLTYRVRNLFPLSAFRPSPQVIEELGRYYAEPNEQLTGLLGRRVPESWNNNLRG